MQTRFLRSQQDLREKLQAEAAAAAQAGEEAEGEDGEWYNTWEDCLLFVF